MKKIKRTAFLGKYAKCELTESFENGKIEFHGTITLNENVKTAQRIIKNTCEGSTPAVIYFFDKEPLRELYPPDKMDD